MNKDSERKREKKREKKEAGRRGRAIEKRGVFFSWCQRVHGSNRLRMIKK